jgi:hypothetical protein
MRCNHLYCCLVAPGGLSDFLKLLLTRPTCSDDKIQALSKGSLQVLQYFWRLWSKHFEASRRIVLASSSDRSMNFETPYQYKAAIFTMEAALVVVVSSAESRMTPTLSLPPTSSKSIADSSIYFVQGQLHLLCTGPQTNFRDLAFDILFGCIEAGP